MIKVNIVGINSNIEKLTGLKSTFNNNYENYYKKNEGSSDYWVGKYATKYYDFQLGNRVTNQKTVNNINSFIILMSFVKDKYSNVATKNISIELDQKTRIEDKYKRIVSFLNDAIDKLNDVNNISTGSAISTINNVITQLDLSKERTLDVFDKVNDYETQIATKAGGLDINKVEELDIKGYMVN